MVTDIRATCESASACPRRIGGWSRRSVKQSACNREESKCRNGGASIAHRDVHSRDNVVVVGAGADSNPLGHLGAGRCLRVEIYRLVAAAAYRAGRVHADWADCSFLARTIRGPRDECAVVVQAHICADNGGGVGGGGWRPVPGRTYN